MDKKDGGKIINIEEKEKYTLINSAYGKDISQYGNLYIPKGDIKGTICLFHGGFWKMPYDLHQMDQLCEKLLQENFIVWNIEYRRSGSSERKWIDPFEDSIGSINHLIQLKKTYDKIDLNKIILMGHSAGGHLAIWLGTNNNISKNKLEINPNHIVGLAPIIDLISCYRNNSGNQAVNELLQCSPTENLERYKNTSPIELLPLNTPTIIFHGDKDEYLSIEMTRKFAEKNDRSETQFSLVEIEGGFHMDFIDPNSKSIQSVIKYLYNISASE